METGRHPDSLERSLSLEALPDLCQHRHRAIRPLHSTTAFRRAGTTVNPLQPENSSALVVGGIYRYTRNPMYLALLMLLFAWGIVLSNPYSMLAAWAFVPYMNRFQIRPEERAMTQRFGEEFLRYAARVRRWI